jgi:heme exporter protein A
VLFSGLTLRLASGTLLRVSGPNGSGKTSLLRVLCGLLQPTRGAVRWRGSNIRVLKEDYWRDLAYVGHLNGVKDDLSAIENLQVSTAIAGMAVTRRQAHAALSDVGLAGCEDLVARFLSQGQRRRIALARLFLSSHVPLWILDEPFTALDNRGVGVLSECISGHLAAGNLVILTTHQDVRIAVGQTATVALGDGADSSLW